MSSSAFMDRTALGRQLSPYLALSRTPHGIVDMATPALAALLCLGHCPPLPVVVVGLITVFAGYTAVYALNDLVDLPTDMEKVRRGGYSDGDSYIDGVLTRHPIAKGVISFYGGLAWAVAWGLVAMAGAYWLNPICFYLFLTGGILEIIYCKLLQVTPLRTLFNGIVKTIGSLAAVFAVQPEPSVIFLVILFSWIFFWEIGGQNIPNDWTDLEEDRQFGAQTIPLRLGTHRAGLVSMTALVAAFFLQIGLFWLSPIRFNALILVVAVAVNFILLLKPALALATLRARRTAMELFNRASYYPLSTLGLVLLAMIVK